MQLECPDLSRVYAKRLPSLVTPLPAITAPKPMANNTIIPGATARNDSAPLALPLLVLPYPSLSLSLPLCPFDVANIDGSTVAVCAVLVKDVVEKVC